MKCRWQFLYRGWNLERFRMNEVVDKRDYCRKSERNLICWRPIRNLTQGPVAGEVRFQKGGRGRENESDIEIGNIANLSPSRPWVYLHRSDLLTKFLTFSPKNFLLEAMVVAAATTALQSCGSLSVPEVKPSSSATRKKRERGKKRKRAVLVEVREI